MKRKILVIGSYNVGLTINVERLPRIGETVIGTGFRMSAGGKGSNQAIAAKRLGGKVEFSGCVGDDSFGSEAIALWDREGIEHSSVKVVKGRTGVGLIFVDPHGENMIAVDPGANLQFKKRDIEEREYIFEDAGLVLLQLENDLEMVSPAVELAKRHGALVLLNPAPARKLPNSVIQHVDILTPNQTELSELTGNQSDDVDGSAQALRSLGVKTVIVTLGRRGAKVFTEDDSYSILAPVVKVIDPTGAGDAFNGALSVALMDGEPLRQAVTFACYAAALKVTHMDAVPGLPYRSEVEEFMRNDALE